MLIGALEQAEQELFIRGADHVQTPQSPQLAANIRLLPQHLQQQPGGSLHWLPADSPLLQLVPRLADKPLVLVQLQPDQLSRRQLPEINSGGLHRLAVADPEDPAGGPVNSIVFVALADIRPVENKNLPGGSLQELDPAEPGVARLDHVLSMHLSLIHI